MGIAALILGIIGIICCILVVVAPAGVILTLIGLILAIIDTIKKEKSGGKKGLSIASIVICAITFVILVFESLVVIWLGFTIYSDFLKSDFFIDGSFIDIGIQDKISGYSFVDQDENSLLKLNEDGTFKYYKSEDDLNNNYYEGKYKVYVGEKAIDYIANDLEKYGVTEQEQRKLIKKNENYSIENYYCLVLTNKKCIINGENTLKSVVETPYYGFYLEDKQILDIANMNTGTYYNFLKEK